MNEAEFGTLIKSNEYQIFLFDCMGAVPFMFARHPWFVVNQRGAVSRWEIFWQADKPGKISWGHLHKDCYAPSQGIEVFFSSETWTYGSTLLGFVEGEIAARMGSVITSSPQTYPYNRRYSLFPGPNSNTYVQWVIGRFPEAKLSLSWNSFGKHFRIPTSP